MPDHDEHREFTRSALHVNAEATAEGGESATGTASDLGMNGVWIACDHPFPMGATCCVRLMLDMGDRHLTIHTRGRVARSSPSGMGIAFFEIEADDVEDLRRLILYNSPDAERAEWEFEQHVGIRPPGA